MLCSPISGFPVETKCHNFSVPLVLGKLKADSVFCLRCQNRFGTLTQNLTDVTWTLQGIYALLKWQLEAECWIRCCSLVKVALKSVLEAAQSNHKSILFVGRAAFHTSLNNVQVHKQLMLVFCFLWNLRDLFYIALSSVEHTHNLVFKHSRF